MSPRYVFFCPGCSQNTELVLPSSEIGNKQKCECGVVMQRNFQAELPHVVGDRKYHTEIHSDALAISPDQVEEHRRAFPDVKLDEQCRPVFETFRQHEDYLKATGFQKLPQHKKSQPNFRKRYPRHAPAYEA